MSCGSVEGSVSGRKPREGGGGGCEAWLLPFIVGREWVRVGCNGIGKGRYGVASLLCLR